jgi:hypothetical protein
LIIMAAIVWLVYNSIKSGPKVEIDVGNGA